MKLFPSFSFFRSLLSSGNEAASFSSLSVAGSPVSSSGQRARFGLKYGVLDLSLTFASRTSNVATLETSLPHGMIAGHKILIDCSDNTYDATSTQITLTAVTLTSFSFANVGADSPRTACTGTITGWTLLNDGLHAPTAGVTLGSISASGININIPTGTVVQGLSFGNHQNNNSGRFVPFTTGLGLSTIGIALRYQLTTEGRISYNGSAADPTLNASWTKEGDTTSVSGVGSTINAFFIGHSAHKCVSTGKSGVAGFPLVNLTPCGNNVDATLPNYHISPFTATAYRPAETGFYCQFRNPTTGAIMTPTDIQALTAGQAQLLWTRTVDCVLPDHTLPPSGCTFWVETILAA